MERCWLVLWISVTCLFGGALPQYRDKNISTESDAVQEILARYLQKRLQGAQLFSPPPPSVLFNLNRQSRARKTEDKSDEEVDVDLNRTESQEHREDYDDYEDDLQGFEDSERSRTRINLFDRSHQSSPQHQYTSGTPISVESVFISLTLPLLLFHVQTYKARCTC